MLLGILGAVHAGYAALGGKPWSKELTKRIAAGKLLLLNHYITIGLWYAAAGGAALCFLGALSLWWAGRKAAVPAAAAARTPSRIAGKGFWIGMAAVFAVALVTRVPRMSHSFWNDEMKAMEMFVIGGRVPDDVRHHLHDTWPHAIYGNPEANNHVLCTLETRLMHKLWLATHTPTPGAAFSEAWLRFPALLWGLLGVGLVGCLGQRLGGTRMGIAAALLLALHPWHIRFSTETRGYAAAMTGVLLAMVCLHALLQNGDRRPRVWLCLGTALFFGMLANSACAPLLVGINVLAAIVVVGRRDWQALACLIATNCVAATLFLDFYGPSIFQVSAFLKEKVSGHLSPISLDWWQDILSAFTSGEDWHRGWWSMENLPATERYGLLTGCYGLLLLSLWSIAWRGPPAMKVMASAWGLSVVLLLLQNILSSQAMLSWYLCPLLPGMVLCMAWGLMRHPWAGLALAGLWLVCLSPTGWKQVVLPRQPVRDAGQFVASHWPNALIVYFGISEAYVSVYLPATLVLKHEPGEPDDVVQLKTLEQRAAQEGRPFVIWYGGHQETRTPEFMEYLRGSGFTEKDQFKGASEIYDLFVVEKPPPPRTSP